MLVSIIIPVYNTEYELLARCVNSAVGQEHKDIEVILVDDGSTAEIAEYCDLLGKGNEKILVIHQRNSGVSAARNAGTAAANGEYIMYLDADDLLAAYAVREGVETIKATGADYVFGGLLKINSYGAFDVNRTHVTKPVFKVYAGDELNMIRRSFLTQRGAEFRNIEDRGAFINRGPCARLVSASIAKRTGFDTELTLGEDVEWNMRVLQQCRTIAFLPSIWYGYLQTESSALHRYYGNRRELLEKYLLKLYRENEAFFQKNIGCFAVNMSIALYIMLNREYLSPECPLTERQKQREIREMLKSEPWKILTGKEGQQELSRKHKTMIRAAQAGAVLPLLRIWKRKKEFGDG